MLDHVQVKVVATAVEAMSHVTFSVENCISAWGYRIILHDTLENMEIENLFTIGNGMNFMVSDINKNSNRYTLLSFFNGLKM